MKFKAFVVGLLLFGLLSLLWLPLLYREDEPERSPLLVPMVETDGFARAQGPRLFEFPADHGAHPEYQSEWWYYTGNLQTTDGRHLCYQLTWFRRALAPPTERQERASAWAANHVYMAHLALTDVNAGRHQAFERFARGAAGLAGAQASPYRVWLEDWRIQELGPGVYHLQAAQGDFDLNLQLADVKGPVLQGQAGYSQKGPDPDNASYYYSQTRLDTSGEISIGGDIHTVAGLSWMDHEFSTSALAPDQVGWDWFALHLDDGSELLVFQVRKADGSPDVFSSGALVAPDGSARQLGRDDFEISVLDTWRSPHSDGLYPARWRVSVPSVDLTLQIVPHLADQEMNVSYTYWEGAVSVSGTRAGRAISGNGYVELTGYVGSMQDQF